MKFKFIINFTSFWQIGTGREAGTYADSLTLKDANNLPYIPGKTLKGIFKDAFIVACENDWFKKFGADNHIIESFFGKEGANDEKDNKDIIGNELNTEGVIKFSNANLIEKKAILDKYKDKENVLLGVFYKVIQSTKIDSIKQVAKHQSLHSYEVCVPVNLIADVEVEDYFFHELNNKEEFISILKDVCSLVTEIGGKRRRGFGDCFVRLVEVN